MTRSLPRKFKFPFGSGKNQEQISAGDYSVLLLHDKFVITCNMALVLVREDSF